VLTHIDKSNLPSMVDVSEKENSIRVASAISSIQLPEQMRDYFTGDDFKLKKGPVFQTAIIAATMAVKKTHETIPLCHQVPIESCKVNIEVNDDLRVDVTCKVRTSYKTGIEMEALHGAMVACLTIYDMCKAVSHNMVIGETKLLSKSGGKSPVLNNVKGLILTGGKSSRMNRDKALIEYKNRPHALYLKSLLEKYCDEVFISSRKDQWDGTPLESEKLLFDDEKMTGPMAGMLAAFNRDPSANWIVIACDLPYINESTIETLIENYDPSKVAISFKNKEKGFAEPLCTLYTNKAREVFEKAYLEDTRCPVKVLKSVETTALEQRGKINLSNINTPTEYQEAKELLAKGESI